MAAGRSVVVLEARDRVGGRTLNHDLGDGQVVEAGGQFVGPTQNHILGLAAELDVKTFPAYTEGEAVYVRGGRAKRYAGDVPPDPTALADVAVTMARIDRLARRIPLGAPWQARNAARLDAVTFDSWIRDTTRQRRRRRPGQHLLRLGLRRHRGGCLGSVQPPLRRRHGR